MIDNNYDFEKFTNPSLTYNRISDKVKLGQPIFNQSKNLIEKIDLRILEKIIDFENDTNNSQKYFLLNLTDTWLVKIFDFDSHYLAPQYMTVFTSNKHGLKIHKVRNNFNIACTIKEKSSTGIYKGTHNYKPLILNVNELMDYLYLIKREEFDLSKTDIEFINKVIIN